MLVSHSAKKRAFVGKKDLFMRSEIFTISFSKYEIWRSIFNFANFRISEVSKLDRKR